MVNDNMSVITKTQAPGPALEVRPWSVIRQDHGADVIAGRVEYGKVPDRVAQRHVLSGVGPGELPPIAKPHQNKPLAMLGHPVEPGIDETGIRVISGMLQPTDHPP